MSQTSNVECRNCKFVWTSEEHRELVVKAIKAVGEDKPIKCGLCLDELHLYIDQDDEGLLFGE